MKHLCLLQQWEGVVEEVSGGGFCARLHDLTVADHPEEFAEFNSIDCVPENMRDLVQPGGVFYWTIVRNQAGEVENFFTFPRIVWTKEELEAAEREAAHIREFFGLDS